MNVTTTQMFFIQPFEWALAKDLKKTYKDHQKYEIWKQTLYIRTLIHDTIHSLRVLIHYL